MNDSPIDPGRTQTSLVTPAVVGLILAGLSVAFVISVLRAREAAQQSSSRSRLKMLGIDVHNYHDTCGAMPFGRDSELPGARHHSWQTRVLPFVESSPLYNSIDLDSPWDSPGNAPQFATVLPWFRNPGVDSPERDADGYALSHYSANERLFPEAGVMTFREIEGGLGHTLMTGEINANFPAWADPSNKRDPTLGLNADPNGFGSPYSQGTQFTLCDGSVRTLSDDIAPVVLRQLAEPASRP